MANHPPRIPVTISGVGPEDSAHLMQKVADELGLKLVFQPGSNPTVIIQIGAAVKEQNTSHTSSSVGDISDSTIGSIGSAHDVTVFAQKVESASLPDDVKHALTDGRPASKPSSKLNLPFSGSPICPHRVSHGIARKPDPLRTVEEWNRYEHRRL